MKIKTHYSLLERMTKIFENKTKVIVILVSLLSITARGQDLKKFYRVEIDTIQHMNWNPSLSFDQALSTDQVQYPYYYADHIVWEYDLVKMTATWIGGPNRKVYTIRKASIQNGAIIFEVGNEFKTGWVDKIQTQKDGTVLLTSINAEKVNQLMDGSFSRHVKLIGK
jgi:hypothetical protein